MAWIEQRRRADGGLTARVFWRPGGCRDAPREWETFGAGSDATRWHAYQESRATNQDGRSRPANHEDGDEAFALDTFV